MRVLVLISFRPQGRSQVLRHKPPLGQSAFSLIELLVVVALIAVLISLLLPTLAAARESANRTKCLSNLRQLSMAFVMYLNDNDGRFPRPAQNTVSTPEDWIWFHPGRDLEQGALAKYTGRPFNSVIYRCPSNDVTTHRRFTYNGFTVHYPFSYTVNEAICRIVARGPTLKLSQIRNPSEKILIIDEAANTIDDGCWAWQSMNGGGLNTLSVRHDRNTEETSNYRHGRGNAAFVDGHVAYISRKDSFDPRYFDPETR